MTKLKMTDERNAFKPFHYPWAYDAWLKHEQSHWLHTEVPMLEDVKDWKKKLTPSEKQFLTNIFRFFTQGDIDVAGGYVKNYLPYTCGFHMVVFYNHNTYTCSNSVPLLNELYRML